MKILLIVDVQQGFINDFTKHIPAKIEKHIKHFEYDLIVATRFINKSASLFQSELGFSAMTMLSQETKLNTKLNDAADIVLMKSTYSSITPDVAKLLEKNEVKEVYLAGIGTDTGVMATALQLFDMGVKPKVLSDLCMSLAGEEMNQCALGILRNAIGEVNIL